MTTAKDPIAWMEELVAKMNELAEASPALHMTALRMLSLYAQKLLTSAKQHSAESMKDLLLAEEQYEVNQNKRADELHELKKARQAELIMHKKVKEEADEESNDRYDQGMAKLLELGCKEALEVTAVARMAEACKENARAIATSQGFDEEFWANNIPGRTTVVVGMPRACTVAEVVSGVLPSKEVMAEELAERERLAQCPEMKHFKELKENEEEEAVWAFGEPGEHITFKDMAIIVLKQNNPTLFDTKFSLVHRKLVAVLPTDMMLYNMSHVNSEMMELVVPAMYYAQMCMYLHRLGWIVATPKPCYITGHSDRSMELTPLTTINRWKKEVALAKSMEGQKWYTS
ncbi:hypothetical protein GGH92_003230 [Coemansia sp. RSA 2673]|nr:hypothetical protein GGH13_001796 [Coemansia sp. S155-1]KAJ2347360.1 hypothetical protein GGH92_003230 [Coemansia sp. RSA 2673]